VTLVILERGQDLGQRKRGVGDRAAERPRVEVGPGSLDVDLHVAETAQPIAERRNAGGEHRAVGDHDDVAREALPVFFDERLEVLGADLLLALQEHLHVARKPAADREMRLPGLPVREHLSLVVGGSAGEDAPVTDRRFKGGSRPQLDRVHGLHVVMPIEEHRRRLRRVEPLGVDDRVPIGVDQLRAHEADPGELLAAVLGTAPNIPGARRVGGDAGNGEERPELLEVALAPLLDVTEDLPHGRHKLDARGPDGKLDPRAPSANVTVRMTPCTSHG
jgi:hypothetical protein